MPQRPDNFLITHYQTLFHRYGPNYRSVQWSSPDAQIRRFSVLSDFVESTQAIMDVGCGLGDLLGYLRHEKHFTGRYLGLDFVPEFIEHARQQNGADQRSTFQNFDARYEGFPRGYDVVLISGVFNNLVIQPEAHLQWIHNTIERAFSAARVGVAFNSLSSLVAHQESELYYSDPGKMFSWCVEHVTSSLTLRHDYNTALKAGVPVDYTLYLHR